ncbi:MAG: acyl-CoA reductase, partial [Candidatus Marinimicrobia bacterium]|nr:acyl-CoA reductase [Candidatus Neomarinimicrobiota bacterium]
KQYNLNDISTIDKLVTFYSQSIRKDSINKINKNNLIWRVDNKELDRNIDEFRCASGYFNEFKINHINELDNVIKRNYQTLSYFGVDKNKFLSFFSKKRPLGIDRIVPIGKTLDFSLNWDGYDLINQMSRSINII